MEEAMRNQLIDRMTNAYVVRRHGEHYVKAKEFEPDIAKGMWQDIRRDMAFLVGEIEKRVIMLVKTYPEE